MLAESVILLPEMQRGGSAVRITVNMGAVLTFRRITVRHLSVVRFGFKSKI